MEKSNKKLEELTAQRILNSLYIFK